METPDPPNDTPGALKQVVLTAHDIPWSLRVYIMFSLQALFVEKKRSEAIFPKDILTLRIETPS